MDPEWLKLGTLAAPLVAKAAERAAERSGEQATDSASRALTRFTGWLRQKMSGHPSAAALERVEEVPDSPSRVRVLVEALDERAAADPGFAAELAEHLDQARAGGVKVASVTQSAAGDGNVQVADNQGSVSVSYGAQSGPATSR